MKITGRTYFTGGGGADIGMMAAGVEMVDGVEYVQEIGEWAEKQLGHTVRIESVLDIDPGSLEPTTCFHASPPCPSFSNSNKNKGETENDIALAMAIINYIYVQRPKIFTLENVWGYRKSESWRRIESALNSIYGFSWHVGHLNSADFGVPQTRKRMIVRAVMGTPYIPLPPKVDKWVGWYEAIEDLIDTFPESEFAPWQYKRLPDEFKTLIMRTTDSGPEARHKPRNANAPMQTMTKTTGWKAFVFGNGSFSREVEIEEPHPAITAHHNQAGIRAFLVDGDQTNGNRETLVRSKERPSLTQMAGGSLKRAWLKYGKVISITPRGHARFQSFPDWYELPKKITLATTIIGNSVPPLMMQKIYEQLLRLI